MSDLSPNSYLDLAERIRDNSDLASDYNKRLYRLTSEVECDETCMLDTYCD